MAAFVFWGRRLKGRQLFWGKKYIRVTWLEDVLTSKWPGSFAALAPPLVIDFRWNLVDLFVTASWLNLRTTGDVKLQCVVIAKFSSSWCIISVVSVSLFVCLSHCMFVCQTITFESLDVGNSHSHILYMSRKYRSNSYMKVIWSRSRSQEQKGHKSLFLQSSPVSNSGSIEDTTMKLACSVGFSATSDRMVCRPFLSHDRKWARVTKCTHSRVVGLRLDGILVITVIIIMLKSV